VLRSTMWRARLRSTSCVRRQTLNTVRLARDSRVRNLHVRFPSAPGKMLLTGISGLAKPLLGIGPLAICR
jgi:hypothetical protein